MGRRRRRAAGVSEAEDSALVDLLRFLKRGRYRFITPTPATHARVVARKSEARDVRDVLGWSLPFRADAIDQDIFGLLERGGVLQRSEEKFVSRIRVSTYGDACFIHSAYPTLEADSVFFGPDSYRFANFIRRYLAASSGRVVDVGTGAGIGAMVAAGMTQGSVIGTDINPLALRYARLNLHAANARASLHLGGGLEGVDGPIDVVIANPPYIADAAHRTYRDGGGLFGAEVALSWARDAAARLPRGGRILLYTGSAVVGGAHVLEEPLREALAGFEIGYHEIDPDVFGEELERDGYVGVERIAVVGVVATKL
jgi:methylase of polypeptide subunit release factors